jgi:hypothetical protein
MVIDKIDGKITVEVNKPPGVYLIKIKGTLPDKRTSKF